MRLADFDYELPEQLIAKRPPARRRDSRLLHVDVRQGRLADRHFADLPTLLRRGDLLVCNDTRVVPARLMASKPTGGRVEILVERDDSSGEALVHLRSNRRSAAGTRLLLADGSRAEVVGRDGNLYRLRFERPVAELMAQHGEVPLPPYLQRPAEAEDTERYQTVYAKNPGAAAAPTAGLHFDDALFDELRGAGIGRVFVTLHVGAGTFQSLRHDRVDDNVLHAEQITVSAETAEAVAAARRRGGRIVAVGTTSVRALEAASTGGQVRAYSGETDLFIRPGYRFNSVDLLLTNFHLPKSSLLMLVAALAGRERMLDAYRHAVAERYRFFSYGDAMLIDGLDTQCG